MRPTVEADFLVKTDRRLPADATETFRIRVDRNALHQWEADTAKLDSPAREGQPASFGTWGAVPDRLVRGLIAELASGKRITAQLGDLPTVTLDLHAARADIVEFRSACGRMQRNFQRSPPDHGAHRPKP